MGGPVQAEIITLPINSSSGVISYENMCEEALIRFHQNVLVKTEAFCSSGLMFAKRSYNNVSLMFCEVLKEQTRFISH